MKTSDCPQMKIIDNKQDWHIVFDVGGCILNQPLQWIAENYQNGQYRDQYALMFGKVWQDFDAGQYTFEEICEHYSSLFTETFPEDPKDFKAKKVAHMIDFAWHNLDPNWPMIHFINHLSDIGFNNIYLLTNGARGYFDVATSSVQYQQKWNFTLRDIADEHHSIVSADHKMRKPDPAIYQLAEKKWGLTDRSKVIFVDDSEQHILAAQQFGWHGIVYDKTNNEQFFDVWQQFGVHYEPRSKWGQAP